jgi:hypothetical protein
MRRAGLARGGSLDNALVFRDGLLLNPGPPAPPAPAAPGGGFGRSVGFVRSCAVDGAPPAAR